MRITALVENTCAMENLKAEHGLSLHIELNNHKILFDMGQTDMFAENAEKLDINLEDVDVAVLSHGHYDHGGGLEKFLKINQKAKVYLNRHAFGKYYNGCEKYIGLDESLKLNSRLIFVDDEYKIADGLFLFAQNQKKKKYDLGSFGLNMENNGKFMPDDFKHEQYLLIEENGKKVLISGCSHKGILDITDWFKPDVLIGGFHFSKLPLDEKLKEYALILNEYDTVFYTCHCTGEAQFEYMKNYIKRLNYISVGDSINI